MCPFTGVSGFIFPWWKCWKNKMPLKICLIKIRKRPYMNIFSFTPLAYAPGREKRGKSIRGAAALRLRLHSGRHSRRSSFRSCGASLTHSLPTVVRGPDCAVLLCKTACPTNLRFSGCSCMALSRLTLLLCRKKSRPKSMPTKKYGCIQDKKDWNGKRHSG